MAAARALHVSNTLGAIVVESNSGMRALRWDDRTSTLIKKKRLTLVMVQNMQQLMHITNNNFCVLKIRISLHTKK